MYITDIYIYIYRCIYIYTHSEYVLKCMDDGYQPKILQEGDTHSEMFVGV